MSIRRRSVSPPESEFPLAPMIDMVFLLLVFFMSVSHLAQAERPAEVRLPESTEAKVPEAPTPGLLLTLDADGNWLLNNQRVDAEGLSHRIRSAMTQSGQSVITLRASADAPYEQIRQGMESCRDAGVTDLKFAAYESE